MTATNHTEHYGLSQYTEDDHPTYTGDYNGDMAKIDAAIHAAHQSGGPTAVAYTNDLISVETDRRTHRIQINRRKTLSTLGLTAKEYDMQYSAGYNIVRVGTPTRSTETEDSSHE